MTQYMAMKPLGFVIIGAIHVASYALVIYGGETICSGVGYMAAGIMLMIEVNT